MRFPTGSPGQTVIHTQAHLFKASQARVQLRSFQHRDQIKEPHPPACLMAPRSCSVYAGNSMRGSKGAAFIGVAWILLACGENCIKAKAMEVRSILGQRLKIGDMRERADVVLKNAGIAYGYDRYQNRYQSTIADSRCGPYQAISVYVNFDSSERVSKIEVFETFTGP